MLNLKLLGIYSQILKFLMIDSVQIPWGKGEKVLFKIEN